MAETSLESNGSAVGVSVFVEFSLDGADFPFGRVVSDAADATFELERVVSTDSGTMPLVWVAGAETDEFAPQVRNSDRVEECVALGRVGDGGLYRIALSPSPDGLLDAIVNADATVLEARGAETWTFRLRLPDHEKLTRLYNACLDGRFGIEFDRTYTLTEDTDRGHCFDLSAEQREALVLALRRGYFATPSETSLCDLADRLDITQQALSNRIRRGNEQVLRKTLSSSVADSD